MKSGETRYLVRRIKTEKPYERVRFRLTNKKNTKTKSTDAEDTKDKVLVEEGVFLIPLQQKDTADLVGSVTIEAEIDYEDKSVRYTDYNAIYINDSLGWENITGSHPSMDDGIEPVMDAIEEGIYVIIGPESAQELIDQVTALYQDTKAIAQSVRDDADNGVFDGFSPTVEVKTETSSEYVLTVTDKNGSYDTPNLKGSGSGTTDYDDLANKPTFNGTTIQGDLTDTSLGVATKTETTNALNTAKGYADNIALDLGNGISVSIDSSTYVMTVSLKHGNTTLDSGSIDLPLESMVVGGSYDDTTKKIILTLQNGQTVEFSVADLVSGLVSTSDLETALANYQVALTVTGHGTLNNGTLNIDASKTWFGTDTSDRISDSSGDYDGIAVGDLYVVTVNYQSIVKVVTSVGESQGTPYFDVKPVDNTIVSSNARPNNITDHQGHNIDLGCVWVDTTNNRVSVLKSYTGSASETVFNWIDLSNGGSYSAGDGIDISNDTVSVDLKSGSKLQFDNGELDVDLSEKEDKTTISTDTTTTSVTLTLADNHEYRYTQDLASLTLTMPNGDFIASVVFVSGTTPTSATYDSSIKWSGDDVTSNAFVPSASKTYNIVFWFDGININAISRSA